MNAALMDWSGIHRLRPEEWPEGALAYMEPAIIQVLSDLRGALPDDHAMIPSPLLGGHIRVNGSKTSRHYVGNGRLSDATDVFMAWPHVWEAWRLAQRDPRIGGIGLYTDMMLRGTEGDYAMLHLDLRPERVLWVGWRQNRNHPTQYVYHHRDPLSFHRLLCNRGQHG